MENIGYNFQNGVGVAVDYAQAWSWLYKAAALGSANAENQLGWMYQHGQGVTQDNARAVAWYRLANNQGNTEGRNNLRDLCADLELRDDEPCDSSDSVNDPAIETVQRRARILDLRAQITGLETDALQDDISAHELANMGENGKHKNDNAITQGITKTMDAIGTVVGAPTGLQAATLREEAAHLREELAQLQSLDQSSAYDPPP
jgi:TPR repeat protein